MTTSTSREINALASAPDPLTGLVSEIQAAKRAPWGVFQQPQSVSADPLASLRASLRSAARIAEYEPPLAGIVAMIEDAARSWSEPIDAAPEPVWEMLAEGAKADEPKAAGAEPAVSSVVISPRAASREDTSDLAEVMLEAIAARALDGPRRAEAARALASGIASGDEAALRRALEILIMG